MAQVNENRGSVARFTFRTLASVVGLIGAVIALVIDILYSLTPLLGRVAGITDDATHFWWELFVILVGTVGAFLAPILPILSAIMLLGAGIAFFIVGWWAAIASPFFIVAALMTFSSRRVNVPGMA